MGSIRESGGQFPAKSSTGGAPRPGVVTQAGAAASPGSGTNILSLTARLHLDSLRTDPVGYFQAIWWRLRGLKVRSRNRLSALGGRSRYAYPLWMARDEPKLLAKLEALPDRSVRIVPVIDCSEGSGNLEATLSSLAGATETPILIGAGTIDRPSDLAALAGKNEVWICPLRCGDRLAPSALATYAQCAAASEASVIYADDDLIDADGTRSRPHFKPDWNAELFRHHDFISGACIVRASKDVLERLPDEHWTRALIDRQLEGGAAPVHLPYVLHHRRDRPAPVIPARPSVSVPAAAPLVSAIIPTRNQCALLRTCVEGLMAADYPAIEAIVIDNGSDEPEALDYLRALESRGLAVLRMPGPFNFSALNNEAVRAAKGDYLCFLNNDVEMLDPDWLGLLVGQAIRPEVGAVGARLLYEDRTIQHAGVVTGIGGGAGHAHRYEGEDEPGYFYRARLPQEVSAVTAACMVVAKDKFLAVGGFDEAEFPVAFNDVDLCLKLNQRGWQSFYEPRATLIHHESKSRGSDTTDVKRARFAGELAALKRKWNTDSERDPFHHPQLSPFCEQFVVAI